ncbi:porin PorA family protein [Gordonia aichiensis]|uniref:porin PorA family protein n=1 Tax=Gordonia aichiensis TaxID=36820 RepID=UPI00326418DA
MKRVALALPALLGIACIAAAIAIPTYLVPKLRVVPLDLDITSVATSVPADGQAGDRFPAVIFDRCSVTKPKAAQFSAHLTQQRRSVIVDPSDANQATLQSGQTVQVDRIRDAAGKERDLTMASSNADRKCDDALLTATVDRVSVNRQTSVPNGVVSSLQLEAVPEGGNVDEASVRLDDRKGFQYKFGFDVQKRDYYYYDTNTRQDAIAKFVEEKTIDGVKTYHFVADVPETDLSNLPNPAGEAPLGTILNMPAKWWGIKGKGVKANDIVTMHRYGQATRHVYVEPQTGTILYGMEDQEQYFKSPDDSAENPRAIRDFRMDALKGRFEWSQETVAHQADRAKGYMNQLRWGGTIAPIILGVVGVLLLLAWAALLWLGRRRGSDPSGEVPVDELSPDDDGAGTAATPDEQTTVLPTAPPAYPAYTEPEPGPQSVQPDDSATRAIPTYRPDDLPPAEFSSVDETAQTEILPSSYAWSQEAASPADVTDTEAFRAPADGFSPMPGDARPGQPYPFADPTRPMPDVQRHAPQPGDDDLPGRHER